MNTGPNDAERALKKLGWKPEPGDFVWHKVVPELGPLRWERALATTPRHFDSWSKQTTIRITKKGKDLTVYLEDLAPRIVL